jgi:hypothetical protein
VSDDFVDGVALAALAALYGRAATVAVPEETWDRLRATGLAHMTDGGATVISPRGIALLHSRAKVDA